MKIEIDQSGKIENTNRKTIIAFSDTKNTKNGALVISARDKRSIQTHFRSIGKPRLFIHLSFVVLVYLLIKDRIKDYDQIVIDEEYPGYDKLLIQSLRNLLKISKVENVSISIAQIGKKSPAHDLAWHELQLRVQKVAKRITSDEVIKVLKKSGSI